MDEDLADLLAAVREISKGTGYYMSSKEQFFPPTIQVSTELWHRLRLIAARLEARGPDAPGDQGEATGG